MKVSITRSSLGLANAYEEPQGPEALVARAFAQSLQIDRVGRDDCFFDLGGDSLAAEELALIVSRDAGVVFPVSLLAESSTPRLLAAALAIGQAAANGASPSAGSRPPIFSVHGMQGFMLPSKDFMAGLHPAQAFHMFELPGLRNKQPRLKSIGDIARTYRQELALRQPDGPIYLCGFCMGSLIALEMAMQFAAAGRPVSKLVLVEPSLAGPLLGLFDRGHWDSAAALARLQDESHRSRWEAMFRAQLLKKRENGRDHFQKKYADHDFSADARAKLMAAYHVHRPQAVSMPTYVIVSRDRAARLGDPSPGGKPTVWDQFIPNRRVFVAGETHTQVLASSNGKTSALIQQVFDGVA